MTVKKCFYKDCRNNSNENSNLRFFHFPTTEMRKHWLEACNNVNLDLLKPAYITRYCYVCENHFDRTDYYLILAPFKGKLKKSAIPHSPNVRPSPHKTYDTESLTDIRPISPVAIHNQVPDVNVDYPDLNQPSSSHKRASPNEELLPIKSTEDEIQSAQVTNQPSEIHAIYITEEPCLVAKKTKYSHLSENELGFKKSLGEVSKHINIMQPKKCCFRSCQSSSDKDNLQFFHFKKIGAESWRKACQNEYLYKFKISTLIRNFYVCELHFTENDFNYLSISSERRLKRGVVPKLLEESDLQHRYGLNETLNKIMKRKEIKKKRLKKQLLMKERVSQTNQLRYRNILPAPTGVVSALGKDGSTAKNVTGWVCSRIPDKLTAEELQDNTHSINTNLVNESENLENITTLNVHAKQDSSVTAQNIDLVELCNEELEQIESTNASFFNIQHMKTNKQILNSGATQQYNSELDSVTAGVNTDEESKSSQLDNNIKRGKLSKDFNIYTSKTRHLNNMVKKLPSESELFKNISESAPTRTTKLACCLKEIEKNYNANLQVSAFYMKAYEKQQQMMFKILREIRKQREEDFNDKLQLQQEIDNITIKHQQELIATNKKHFQECYSYQQIILKLMD